MVSPGAAGGAQGELHRLHAAGGDQHLVRPDAEPGKQGPLGDLDAQPLAAGQASYSETLWSPKRRSSAAMIRFSLSTGRCCGLGMRASQWEQCPGPSMLRITCWQRSLRVTAVGRMLSSAGKRLGHDFRGARADVIARLRAGLDHPAILQHRVGLHHGVDADVQLGAELPDRRQPLADPKSPPVDQAPRSRRRPARRAALI